MQTRYLNEFFSFRCSGDILSACAPINNGAKEITEAMGVRNQLKRILLKEPMKYSVIDFCSGNALVPLLTVFTLPAVLCTAIDKNRHNRHWEEVQRFNYYQRDINDSSVIDMVNSWNHPIITACHACGNLSKRTIEIFKESKAEYLVLMPCCVGRFEQVYPDFIREKIGKPDLWALHLAGLAGGKLIEDKSVISPRNKIIVASK